MFIYTSWNSFKFFVLYVVQYVIEISLEENWENTKATIQDFNYSSILFEAVVVFTSWIDSLVPFGEVGFYAF